MKIAHFFFSRSAARAPTREHVAQKSEVARVNTARIQPRAPRRGELNGHILATLSEYRRRGEHAYYWPRGDESWHGVTRDISYLGQVYAKGDPHGRAFCSGITFEVFMRAYAAWAADQGQAFVMPGIPDLSTLDTFRRRWWGKERKDTMAHALTSFGLGAIIENKRDAQPGDFVQLWRHNGSGHSAVFMGWEIRRGKIVGIRYWSVQPATDGIGYRTEHFGRHGARVDPRRVTLVRVGR